MSKYASNNLSDDAISTIVKVHNQLRAQVSNGKAKAMDGVLPNAADMLQMYWDESIAAKAQTWANNCQFEHSSSSSRTIDKMKIGENLYMSMTSQVDEDPNLMQWENGVNDWYGEIKDYTIDKVKKISFNGPTIGHFSQVIWSKSYLVGCGFCSWIEQNMLNKLYVCQYGPAGNFINQPNYKDTTGSAASACPEGSQTSTVYPGLCCVNGACNKDSIKIKGDFSKNGLGNGAASPSGPLNSQNAPSNGSSQNTTPSPINISQSNNNNGILNTISQSSSSNTASKPSSNTPQGNPSTPTASPVNPSTPTAPPVNPSTPTAPPVNPTPSVPSANQSSSNSQPSNPSTTNSPIANPATSKAPPANSSNKINNKSSSNKENGNNFNVNEILKTIERKPIDLKKLSLIHI